MGNAVQLITLEVCYELARVRLSTYGLHIPRAESIGWPDLVHTPDLLAHPFYIKLSKQVQDETHRPVPRMLFLKLLVLITSAHTLRKLGTIPPWVMRRQDRVLSTCLQAEFSGASTAIEQLCTSPQKYAARVAEVANGGAVTNFTWLDTTGNWGRTSSKPYLSAAKAGVAAFFCQQNPGFGRVPDLTVPAGVMPTDADASYYRKNGVTVVLWFVDNPHPLA